MDKHDQSEEKKPGQNPADASDQSVATQAEQDPLEKCRTEAWADYDKKHGINRDQTGQAVDANGMPALEINHNETENPNGEISRDGVPLGKGDPALLDGPKPSHVAPEMANWISEQEKNGTLDQQVLAEKVIKFAEFAMKYIQAQEHVDPEAASEEYNKTDEAFADIQRKLDGCHMMKVQPYIPWVFSLRE